MKLKIHLLLLCLLALPYVGIGQMAADSADARKWYAPDAVTLQFAGNTGFLSLGANYSFQKDKVNAELLYGFVPKLDAEEVLHLLTLKGIYKPIRRVELGNDFTLTPLRMNLGISYYFRDQFSTTWDSAYPKNYYWWTSSLRLTGGLGSELHYPLRNSNTFRELTFYGEVGTYDLIVTSAVKDPTLKAWDIISFALGARANF
ncbi:hypothetical protein [Pontibacter akesuensis]|uniref:Outer membrane protein beta-barrel domain-containing protein n=1 Tax=Pontibacter akesuensis TaxID=388950 RepID=A0A1I7KGS6_9BACT|nr:hypothetical protein [Pontibacter akesuensis]GHA79174.1 hypothetical protein GCM10007389_36640 [Pontibacter akesuensis]SFU96629.1 hypothetical protein SAMN04487941_3724 [Pontibacter akesuensis]